MKGRAILFFLAALSSPFPSPLSAEGGKTAANILQRQFASYGGGMGGAFVAAGPQPDSLDYNPASAATLEKTLLSSSYLRGFSNSYFGGFSVYQPLGSAVLMGRVIQYNGGDITIHQTGQQSFKTTAAQDWVYSLGVAAPLPFYRNLQFGAVYKHVRLKLLNFYHANGHVFDLGVRWQSPWKGLAFGASYQNLGQDIAFENIGDPPPVTWRAGYTISHEFFAPYKWLPGWEQLQALDLGMTGDVVQVRNERISPRIGFKMGLDIPGLNKTELRIGHQFNRDAEGLTFGLGFGEGAWKLDYALGAVQHLRMRHQATLSFWFGLREDEDY